MTKIAHAKKVEMGVIRARYREKMRYRFKTKMSRELYAEILEAQNGRCAICRRPPEANKRLSLDHDHITNRIRGLLCTRCNSGLGYFRESIEAFYRAVNYLISDENYGEVN